MKRILLIAFFLLMPAIIGGCTQTPNQQAAELRALYTEVQNQANLAKADPNVDQKKVKELQATLDQVGGFVDAIEIAAAKSEQNPGEMINFQTLYAMYKPKVESLLISYVLKRYLGM